MDAHELNTRIITHKLNIKLLCKYLDTSQTTLSRYRHDIYGVPDALADKIKLYCGDFPIDKHQDDPMGPKEIGYIRKSLGLTQRRLAEIVGANYRIVIDWEMGRRVVDPYYADRIRYYFKQSRDRDAIAQLNKLFAAERSGQR